MGNSKIFQDSKNMFLYIYVNYNLWIICLLGSGIITSTKIFNYETDPRRFLLIVDTGGLVRHVLTINIINVPEPPDCTADPQFSLGTGMIHNVLIIYF